MDHRPAQLVGGFPFNVTRGSQGVTNADNNSKLFTQGNTHMEHLYKIQPEETKTYRNYIDIEEGVEELNALDELDAINAELEALDPQKEHEEIVGEL